MNTKKPKQKETTGHGDNKQETDDEYTSYAHKK